MLILDIKPQGEKIFVLCPDGTELAVCVTSLKGYAVAVGIEAPKDYAIVRESLLVNANQ